MQFAPTRQRQINLLFLLVILFVDVTVVTFLLPNTFNNTIVGTCCVKVTTLVAARILVNNNHHSIPNGAGIKKIFLLTRRQSNAYFVSPQQAERFSRYQHHCLSIHPIAGFPNELRSLRTLVSPSLK
jgi:hypothetical protein